MLNLSFHGVKKLKSFFSLKHLFHFSTSLIKTPSLKTTHFMVDFLVNSLEFSRDEAISVSTKLTHLKSTQNPSLALNFFKQIGLDSTQIKSIVSFRPRLLNSSVEKTLKPKLRVFQAVGFNGSSLVDLINGDPFLFTKGLNTTIIPCVEFLQRVLGTKENVMKAIKRSKLLISQKSPDRMQINMSLLQKYGVENRRIVRLIVDSPKRFLLKPERLEKIVERVESDFGIRRGSWMFSYAVAAISSISTSTMESKFRIFESFGWSKENVITMTRNLPICLTLSEEKIRSGLNFLMKELGCEPEYIATYPKFLMFSLEKRVVPRHVLVNALKEKKLIKTNPSLYKVVCMTETLFLKEFVMQFKDEAPDVYEAYIESTSKLCPVEDRAKKRYERRGREREREEEERKNKSGCVRGEENG